MELTIKSRKLDQTFTFWKSSGESRYVYLVSSDRPGTLGQQICRGGYLMGSTILCGDEGFETVCKRWYKSFLRNQNDTDNIC